MVFLIQTDLPGWQMASAMSHAIHKIVSKRRCQSHFSSRRSPHHGISKDSDLCASAHRCPHYAYARLIARVTLKLAKPKIPPGKEYITKLSGRYSKERSMITAVGYFVSSAASVSVSSVSSCPYAPIWNSCCSPEVVTWTPFSSSFRSFTYMVLVV